MRGSHCFGQRLGDRLIEIVNRNGVVRPKGLTPQHGLDERAGLGEPLTILFACVVAVVDQRRARRVRALDAYLAGRLLPCQIGPEACGVLLLIDRERMGLPFRFAPRISAPAPSVLTKSQSNSGIPAAPRQ